VESSALRSVGSEKGVRWWVSVLVCALLLVGATGCATIDPDALPGITTAELRAKFGNPNRYKGIRYNQAVGLAFQKAVLANLPGPKLEWANKGPFPSSERSQKTNRRFLGVIPDGVTGAVEGSPSPLPPVITTHPQSTYIEVKAVKGKIDLKYGQYQIFGMLDALRHTPAASSTGPRRAYPSFYLICTGDAMIATDIEDQAASWGILFWVSTVVDLQNGLFQVTSPKCLNCGAVLGPKQVPLPLPGMPFLLGALGGSGMGGLDAPILDDGLVGDPGEPGNTSPNP